MKSTITPRTWRAIYRLLNGVSPIDQDCGRLCGAACCGTEADRFTGESGTDSDDAYEFGIYLMPGEEQIHDRADGNYRWSMQDAEEYEFPESWKGEVYFLHCRGPLACPRAMRPLQCRTFPLIPHLTEEGELMMIYDDADVPYVCPLIEDEIPLNDSFVKATETVWRHLIRDPKIRDLVEMDSQARWEEIGDEEAEEAEL